MARFLSEEWVAQFNAALRSVDPGAPGSVRTESGTFSVEEQVIQLGVEPNRIDLMTSISGLTFDEAWASRVHAVFDGIEVDCIGRDALIRNKRAAGRSKDVIDAEELDRR